jgi:hypothetical protein
MVYKHKNIPLSYCKKKKAKRLQKLVMKILKFLKDGSKNFEFVMQDITFKCKNP